MMDLFSDLQYPRSKDHQSNFPLSAFSVFPTNIRGKIVVPNSCTRLWSFDDTRQDIASTSSGISGPSNGDVTFMRCEHVLMSLAHFGKKQHFMGSAHLLAVKTEVILTKFLLSLVVKSVLRFHVFLISAE